MQPRDSLSAFLVVIGLGLFGCGGEGQGYGEEVAQTRQAATVAEVKDGPVNPELPDRPRQGNFWVHYEWWVSDGLARGDQPTADDVMTLKETYGFRSLVNLRRESNADEAYADEADMHYLHLRIVDGTAPTRRQMVRFLNFVTQPRNQPAFVHCRAGINRTGVAVAVYRMAVQGWSMDDAIDEARSYGFGQGAQVRFVRQFARDLAAGEIDGYPLVD